IWIVPADASEPPKELMAGEKTENSPRFTPDGRHIAFISNRDGASQVYLADTDGRGVKQVTKVSGGVQSPLVVSPDGKKIAFVSDRDGKDREMMSTNRDVWLVSVTGGEPQKITANRAADNQPVFSPDGTLLAVAAQRRPGFESDRWYIDLYDRATGSKRTLFESPDISVEEFTFSSNARSIFFTASEKGTLNLYVVPVAGGTPKLISKGGSIGQIQAAPDFILFSKSTLTAPAELFRVALDGSSTRQLTNENSPWLSQTAMSQTESL